MNRSVLRATVLRLICGAPLQQHNVIAFNDGKGNNAIKTDFRLRLLIIAFAAVLNSTAVTAMSQDKSAKIGVATLRK
jgi:hypothetical protein